MLLSIQALVSIHSPFNIQNQPPACTFLIDLPSMTKPHTCYPSSEFSKLGIDGDSHMISKFKPKIRIIHIYAPEIIKTDAANFKELVQRLTGKPEDDGCGRSKTKTPPTKDLMDLHPKQTMTIEEEYLDLKHGLRVKNEDKEDYDENEIGSRSKSNERFSGFFDGFSELDGFMEELSTMPVDN